MRAASFRRVVSEERGFTLAEMVASIAVFGVLAAISVVILFGVLEQRRVDAAATQFASDLRLAHTSASNQLTDWRVVLMPDGSPVEGCGDAAVADYCILKLKSPYVEGSAFPEVAEFAPRELPEGTRIESATFSLDCSFGDTDGPVPPSECGITKTIEFSSNGTARTLRPGQGGSVLLSSADGTPRHKVSYRSPTSRVRIERNCMEPLCP